MQPGGTEKLLVLNVPDVLVGPPSNVGDKLTQTPIRISLAQLGDGGQQFGPLLAVHGRQSFTFETRAL